jgi:hypothetical protein
MAGLPGLQAGNTFAVERLAFVSRFENTIAGERFQWETTLSSLALSSLHPVSPQASGSHTPLPGRSRKGLARTGLALLRLSPQRWHASLLGTSGLTSAVRPLQ